MQLSLRPAPTAPPDVWRALGRGGQIFVLGLLASAIAFALGAPSWLSATLAWITGLASLVVLWRMLRFGVRKLIWRLRNRLAVAYVFMALIPVLLMLLMGSVVAFILASQMLAYLISSNLDQRAGQLDSMLRAVITTPAAIRPAAIARLGDYYASIDEGFTLHYQADGVDQRYPARSNVPPPAAAWGATHGLVARDGGVYLWSRVKENGASLTASLPLTNELLDEFAAGLGVVELSPIEVDRKEGLRVRLKKKGVTLRSRERSIPAARYWFDPPVGALATVNYANWDEPGSKRDLGLAAGSRFSTVLAALFKPELAATNELARILLRLVVALFIFVELVALAIGISLTRSITGAVNELYQGTEQVMDGNFDHRIRIRGRDQIASLSSSFNRMTENVQHLLTVAKEKERLQGEIEIAREVQAQFYPKHVPEAQTLRLAAACLPARSVSGDFYHYQHLEDGRIAVLLGDVAGKGISAALLMATIQTSCRATLDTTTVDAPERVVAELNRQVCQNSAPEKYATLCFAVYDDRSGELHYTNAAHLPPLILRGSEVLRLNVDGTIVGTFPRAQYGSSRVTLEPGDLLVFFTDGVTEPENDYGEQFGEDRLIETIRRHAGNTELGIINAVNDAVRQWTGSDELQDDLTLLVARRV